MDNGGNNMESTNKRLDEIEATLKDIRIALLGNQYNGDGIVKKVDTIEKRVEKLERNQAAQLWLTLGTGGLGGAGIVKLIEFLSK